MSNMQNTLLHHLRSLAARQASGALPDQQLLEAFLTQRSEMAFTALVRRHGPMVLSVCRRVLRNHHDAEDAFQAVFLVFVRKAASIRKQESVSSFLHGVAYHVAAKLKRTAERRAARERTQARPPFDDPCDDITWRELRSVLDEELAKLPEQHRAPLVLCYLEGKTQDEAARQLGWSKSTFRRRLESGRKALGSRLTHRGVTLSAALSAPLLADAAAQASLPPLLAASTVRAGLASALGNTVNGIVSAQVAALAEGGVGSLLANKASIAAVLLVSLTLGLGGLLAHRAVQSRTLAEAPAAPKTAPSPQSQPARSASKEKAIEIKGRVLDPDGKPVAGAKVYVSTYSDEDKTDPKVRAQTDADGRFRFTAARAEVDLEGMVAAVAPGYGPDWVSMKEGGEGKELTLRLVKDDVPINGRVLDLEGRPVAGVAIRVVRARKMPGEDLTPWLKELQSKANDRNAMSRVTMKYQELLTPIRDILGSPKSVKTDAEGRFQVRGFGRDRVVDLRIEGPGIEYSSVMVLTRPGLSRRLRRDMYGAMFDHAVAPSKPIRGTVRERGSRKPVAGVGVCVLNGRSAITDKDGHYEILGNGKSENYCLFVGGAPVVSYFKEVNDTPGLQPLTVDFEVERAVVLHIRVVEKGTGKPVRGYISYDARGDNPNLARYRTYSRTNIIPLINEKDGSLDMVVLPGAGFIAVRAEEDRFIQARPSEDIESYLHPHEFHALVSINPSEKDPKSRICEIVLDPGRTVTGSVVDPEGQSLAGALIAGKHALHHPTFDNDSAQKLTTPNFTVNGLDPQHPRALVFFHSEKKLSKAVMTRKDEKGPMTVRLEPLAAVVGRLIDARGNPLADIPVFPLFAEKQQAVLPSDLFIGPSAIRDALLAPKAITDKDGRFRIEGLVAGLKYDLGVGDGQKFFGRALKDVAGKHGATVDVGEIKMKAIGPREKP